MLTIILIMLFTCLLLLLYNVFKPSLDYNPETLETILWYNDISDIYKSRKNITLWKTRQ